MKKTNIVILLGKTYLMSLLNNGNGKIIIDIIAKFLVK